MRRLLVWIVSLACGVAAGLGSAWLLTGPIDLVGRDVRIGAWQTGQNTGEAANNPYDRARVAIYGIWALPPSEVLYFTASHDDDGQTLTNRCAYEIRGADLPARWWSVTVYRDFFWVPNDADRYSWTSTTLSREADGGWAIQLNADGEGINGLPMGQEPGDYRLSLRLYHPDAGAVADRAGVPTPSIRRLTCAE